MRNPEYFKYIGLATQLLATLGVAFFIGYQVDHFFHWKYPVLLIILPLAVLILTLWKIVKDTSNTNK